MIWTQLTEGLISALREAGAWNDAAPPRIELAIPRERSHGDWTTNVALLAAKEAGEKPRALAEKLAAAFPRDAALFESVEVAGPGFLNFRYAPEFLDRLPSRILSEGENFGNSDAAQGLAIQVEYVSANPTGPLNVVNARAAAVGAALVRLLRATGHRAEGEFYVNDAGNQVDLLGASVAARFAERIGTERAFPDHGYLGSYVADLAAQLPEVEARRALADADGARWFRERSLEKMLAWQRSDLSDYGAEFANWVRESTLHGAGDVEKALASLEARGMIYRAIDPEIDCSGAPRGPEPDAPRDPATYVRSGRFGDDKDRVVVKSNGVPTYLLPDIAYHRNKRARGFRHTIDLWGPDHHGHILPLKASLAALGLEPDFLEVLIVQQVNLLAGGQPVKMSKRAGEFISLRDLMNDVGSDCAKFFFLLRSTSAHLDFDLDLARSRNDENPAYYVQYAHARIASVMRFAAGRGLAPLDAAAEAALDHPAEAALARQLAAFPEVVRGAATAREPHRIPAYLMETAAELHRFYHACRVVSEDAPRSRARLRLAAAAAVALRNGLSLMGVSAPERMEREAEVEA
ncbi:MAG: arginine--tRNA ligase [Candidatus Eisenbacteria bacterium]|nr:arginine--tRNA ligase [Candidatus Eisenbacteria bacterium]